jgi:hypothetical protein
MQCEGSKQGGPVKLKHLKRALPSMPPYACHAVMQHQSKTPAPWGLQPCACCQSDASMHGGLLWYPTEKSEGITNSNIPVAPRGQLRGRADQCFVVALATTNLRNRLGGTGRCHKVSFGTLRRSRKYESMGVQHSGEIHLHGKDLGTDLTESMVGATHCGGKHLVFVWWRTRESI